MVEIELELGAASELSQKELDCTDVVEIAEEANSVWLQAKIALPFREPLFVQRGEIGSDGRSPDLSRIRDPVAEMKEQLDEFEEIVCSHINGDYFGDIVHDGCKLSRGFDDYDSAYEEAKRLEENIQMLDGSVTLVIDADSISEEKVKQVESRINVSRK